MMIEDIRELIIKSINKAFNVDLSNEKELVKIILYPFKRSNNDKPIKIYIAYQLKNKFLQSLDLLEIANKIKDNIEDSKGNIKDIEVDNDGSIKIDFTNKYYKDQAVSIKENYNRGDFPFCCFKNNDDECKKRIFISYGIIDDIFKPINYMTFRTILTADLLRKILLYCKYNVESEVIINDYNYDEEEIKNITLDIIERCKSYELTSKPINIYRKKINGFEDEYIDKIYDTVVGAFKDKMLNEIKGLKQNNISLKSVRRIIIDILIGIIEDKLNLKDKYIRLSYLMKSDLISSFLNYMKSKNLLIEDSNGCVFLNTSKYGDLYNRKIIEKDGKYTNILVKYINLYRIFMFNKFDKYIFIRSYKDMWEFDMIKIFMKMLNINKEVIFKRLGKLYNKKDNIDYTSLYYSNIVYMISKSNINTYKEELKKSILTNKSYKNIDLSNYKDPYMIANKVFDKISSLTRMSKYSSFDYLSYRSFFNFNIDENVFRCDYFRELINYYNIICDKLNSCIIDNNAEISTTFIYINNLANLLNRCIHKVNIIDKNLKDEIIFSRLCILCILSKFLADIAKHYFLFIEPKI